jgi:hypothetical protein
LYVCAILYSSVSSHFSRELNETLSFPPHFLPISVLNLPFPSLKTRLDFKRTAKSSNALVL